MSLALSCSVSAMSPGLTASFQGSGGAEPYAYAVLAGGAGGTINPSTGIYTAPSVMNSNPKLTSDTIQVTDDDGATTTLPILITNALGLVCDIIQVEMGLAPGRVYLWDQKVNQPNDSGLYVAVGVIRCKPFANNLTPTSNGGSLDAVQSVNMLAMLSIDAISRGPEARDRKEEIILALGSSYAQSQQEKNSFCIGKLPAGGQFVNISGVDGAAIPYRFSLAVNIQYFVRKTKAIPFFDDFDQPTILTDT